MTLEEIRKLVLDIQKGNFTEFFVVPIRFLKPDGSVWDRLCFRVHVIKDGLVDSFKMDTLIEAPSEMKKLDMVGSRAAKARGTDVYVDKNGMPVLCYEFMSSHIGCYNQAALDRMKEVEMGWKYVGTFYIGQVSAKRCSVQSCRNVPGFDKKTMDSFLSTLDKEREAREKEERGYFTNIPPKLKNKIKKKYY